MEYKILTSKNPQYPKKLLKRLGAEAPILYFHGPLKLLDRFTMAVICADLHDSHAMLAANDMLFKIREYALNYTGPWHAIMETEIFRLALDTPTDPDHRRSLTICTARGLTRENWDNFLGDRFGYQGPFTGFPQKEEFYRRAREEELLWLSITEPDLKRFERRNIMLRNWVACALADVVFVPYAEKGNKTLITVKKVVKAGIPIFTVDHECCKDLFDLGVPGFSRKTIAAYLESLGARKDDPPPFPSKEKKGPIEIPELPPSYNRKSRQLSFFEKDISTTDRN